MKMPKYTFSCDCCSYEEELILSIANFIKKKEVTIPCEECGHGFIIQKVKRVSSNVFKDKDQTLLEMKEEIRKTVDKVKNGDLKTINDIYGDTPNPHKA